MLNTHHYYPAVFEGLSSLSSVLFPRVFNSTTKMFVFTGGYCPAEKAIQKMNEEVFAKLEKLFRTCHAMAKHNRPFSDFVWQYQLDKAKRLDVGATYINDKSARSFTQVIAETEHANMKRVIERNKFASILSDGATDCSVTESERVYVRVRCCVMLCRFNSWAAWPQKRQMLQAF